MPSFKCADTGMQCPFEIKTKTDEEMMKAIATHAATAHDLKEVPPDMMVKIKAAIKP